MMFCNRRLLGLIYASLMRIEARFIHLEKDMRMAQQTLDDIVNDVAQETTIENSAVALLTALNVKLAAAGQDPAKLAALHQSIQANITAMAAAIAANTPVDPGTGGTGNDTTSGGSGNDTTGGTGNDTFSAT